MTWTSKSITTVPVELTFEVSMAIFRRFNQFFVQWNGFRRAQYGLVRVIHVSSWTVKTPESKRTWGVESFVIGISYSVFGARILRLSK